MNNLTITTTINVNTFTFLSNITDTNMGTCKYSISGSSNTTFTCNSLTSATAPGFGTYTLFVYSTDLANNENSQNLSFTTSISSGTITIGGGGAAPPEEETLSKEFSVLNTNLQNTLDIKLAKDSVVPREKTIVLINREKKEITIELSCDQTDVNKSSREIDVCAYVKFPNKTLILSSNEDKPTETTFLYYTPDYSNFGENYYFNIIAKQKDSSYFSKLSVSSDVSYLATIFYKWSYLSEKDNITYPVFLVSLIIGSFLLILIVWIFKRRNLGITGLLIGLILFFLSIGLMPIII
jgi:hypothetical protein